MSDSDDDDVPVGELLNRRKASKKRAAPSSSDEEDDVPLSVLRKRAKPAKERAKATKPKAARRATKSPPPKKRKTPAVAASVSRPSKASDGPLNEFYTLKKGELARKLLVRWWYTMDWPAPASRACPGDEYEELDGFPGVWICVEGEHIGRIVDQRDKASCPCVANFCRLPAEVLRARLVAALEAQKIELQEREGPDTALEKQLDDELRWAQRFNVNGANRESARWERQYDIGERYDYEPDLEAFTMEDSA